MGAGASVADATQVDDKVSDETESAVVALDESALAIQKDMQNLINMVDDGAKPIVGQMLTVSAETMSADEINIALKEARVSIEAGINSGGSLFAIVYSSFSSAAKMAPEVTESMGSILIQIGPSLPLIGHAAGALGAMLTTFNQSYKNEKNIESFLLWAQSIRDWLILIADKASTSAAESTLSVFGALKDSLTELVTLMEEQSKKARLSKMLSSSSFQSKFNDAKEVVKSLKDALATYLDQEGQDRQEKLLNEVTSTSLQMNDKMATMDEQLGEIKKLLAVKKEQGSAANVVGDEESALFVTIQDVCGCGTNLPSFKNLVQALETFFLNGEKCAPEVVRGLKFAVDPEDTKIITKLQWINFYRKWTASGTNIEVFLLKLAQDAPPTLMQSLVNRGRNIKEVMGRSKLPSFHGFSMPSFGSIKTPSFSMSWSRKKEEETVEVKVETEAEADIVVSSEEAAN